MIPSTSLLAAGVQQIVEVWRVHLRESQQRYRDAVDFSSKSREATRSPAVCSDDMRTYYRALLDENAARGEYMRILRIYTDLVVSGKTPVE